MKKRIALLLLMTSTAACASGFNGSTPAEQPGWQYVVGFHNNRAAVWLCPTNDPATTCTRMKITEVE